jgi:hypothetical protein
MLLLPYLPSGLFLLWYPIKIIYALLVFPIQATCSAPPPPVPSLLDFTPLTILSDLYKWRSFLLCNSLNSLLPSSLAGRTPFFEHSSLSVCNLCGSVKVRNNVLLLCDTNEELTMLCTSIFRILKNVQNFWQFLNWTVSTSLLHYCLVALMRPDAATLLRSSSFLGLLWAT